MSQKTFTKENAVILYSLSNEKGKKILEEIYGAETFEFDPVKEINSLEDACRYNGSDIENVIPWKNPINADQRCVNAFAFFIEIYRAFNKGETPIWGTGTKRKYSAWMNMPDPSGVGLSLNDAVNGYSDSDVPARLTAFNPDHVKIIVERFPEKMADLMIYSK